MKSYTHSVPLVAFLFLWEAICRAGIINPLLFPPPTAVIHALSILFSEGFLYDILSSLYRVLAGLLIGSTIGISIGVITGRIQTVDRLISPFLNFMRSLPPVALIPFMILWFGLGEHAKILSITFAVFFPVWINTHTGARSIAKEYLYAAHLLPNKKKWFLVYLPASLPYSYAGIRNAIGVAFIMVYVSELAGASSGIGYQISVQHSNYAIAKMMAALITLGGIAAGTDWVFQESVKKIFPWVT